MNFDRTGIILYVKDYEACISFYKDILELEVMFNSKLLTCFKFGSAYLMIEFDDEGDFSLDKKIRQKTCLRMNVRDVKLLSEKLISKGIEVNYSEHDWGTICKFFDPDGNLCAFKDSITFEKQIKAFKK